MITTTPRNRQPISPGALARRVHAYVTDREITPSLLRQELLLQGVISPNDAGQPFRVGVLVPLADGEYVFVTTYGDVL